ncbi:hypothetical protein [Bradyrhizobium sp. Ec3.3]|uniref:hypothetical protein n=1 Tax=Bradyrhizobium sp. Ec3.3 TaxID=189753 RepID=UPI0012EBDC8D|nr:hypothetical protein [Bradyrhizobium sp. Ec3.3]
MTRDIFEADNHSLLPPAGESAAGGDQADALRAEGAAFLPFAQPARTARRISDAIIQADLTILARSHVKNP